MARFLARLSAMNDAWARPFGEFNHRWTNPLFRAMVPIRDLLQGRWLGHPIHAAVTARAVAGTTSVRPSAADTLPPARTNSALPT